MSNLDAFLGRHVASLQAAVPSSDPLRGLYISPLDAPGLLRSRQFPEEDESVIDLIRDIPPLKDLAVSEGFDTFESAALLLALAPELDLRYERVYAYLNDDITRRWPTVDLVLNVLCRSVEEKLASRARFGPESRLVKSGLLRVVADPNHVEPSLLGHFLKPDEQAIQWLAGGSDLDSRLTSFCELAAASGPFAESIADAIAPVWAADPIRLACEGNAATATAAANRIADLLASPLLRARMSEATAAWSRTLFRQARLNSAVVLVEDLDRLERDIDRRFFAQALELHPGAVVTMSTPPWIASAFVTIDLRSSDRAMVGPRRPPEMMNGLVRKLPSAYSWDDIILPAGVAVQLREICDQARHQHTVMARWGFDRKVRRGGNLTALFSGPSGTGKTMAAEILADELGQDLCRIDLSQVMSKFIGDTEKNLGVVFDQAERAGAVLFFDEADALFGKRSPVKDSHDRYANVEVSYLLQRMEEYGGVAILATNLRQNMDTAFVRRLKFSVEFPFPDESIREHIWRIQFPHQAPVAEDVDFAFLAERFPLAGGGIRNVALNAAYLAAAAGERIAMSHLIRGVRREYQKMGRPCGENEFGRYYPLLKEAGSA